MAFISLCRKDNAAANNPGTMLVTHRVAKYPLALTGPAQPWDDGVFAISGDITYQQVAPVPWSDKDFSRVQGETRVLTTQALNQHWAGNPNDSLVGPYAEDTPNTELVYTRHCMYVPHKYTSLVIGASLAPRQVWERLHAAIGADGKEQECKPLLDFLKVCVTREAAGMVSKLAGPWPVMEQPPNEALFKFFHRMVKRDLPGAFELTTGVKPPVVPPTVVQQKNIFSDGLLEMGPLSDTSMFTSNPSIPSEARHPAAEVIISDFQCLTGLGDLPHPVTNIWNHITPQTGTLGGYSTEADVNDHAKKVIVDILDSLRLRDVVKLRYEVEVMRNRPDFTLILANGHPIGTIAGKQPGKDAMCHANILGEVYDQLMHLRSIFRIDTPFSILTCYEQWRVCWLNDAESIKVAAMDHLPEPVYYATPVKRRHGEQTGALGNMTLDDKKDSPPLPPTPSRRESIRELQHVDKEGSDQNFSSHDDEKRLFCGTGTIAWNEPSLPIILASLIKKMMCARQVGHPAVLRFANEQSSAWKKSPPQSRLDFGLCISSSVKNFLFWEDLGHGADGRAFLVSGGTKGAVGVLKFFIGNHALEKAEKEERMWLNVYSHLSSVVSSVRVVQVMRHSALLMPWFQCPERTQADLDAVEKTLKEDFEGKNFHHGDVAWRNVGVYLDKNGKKRAVVFDMQTVRRVRHPEDDDWVTSAVKSLSTKLA